MKQNTIEDEHIIDDNLQKTPDFNINDEESTFFEDECFHLNEILCQQ